jgi:hypothetical protein
MEAEKPVIRHTISCDICGAEMLNANHWFVAREHAGELRISVWNGRNRLRSLVRHLCGHKCLHKLVDDFMAKAPDVRTTPPDLSAESRKADTNSAERRAFPIHSRPVIGSHPKEIESSASLLATPQPFPERASPSRVYAEAWKRERERQEKSENRRSA